MPIKNLIGEVQFFLGGVADVTDLLHPFSSKPPTRNGSNKSVSFTLGPSLQRPELTRPLAAGPRQFLHKDPPRSTRLTQDCLRHSRGVHFPGYALSVRERELPTLRLMSELRRLFVLDFSARTRPPQPPLASDGDLSDPPFSCWNGTKRSGEGTRLDPGSDRRCDQER